MSLKRIFTFFKISFLKWKNWGYSRANFNSITQEILLCDVESWYKNVCKIRNVTFIIEIFKKNVENKKLLTKFKWIVKNQ